MPEVLEPRVASGRDVVESIASNTHAVGIKDARSQDFGEKGGACKSMSRQRVPAQHLFIT